MKLNNIKKMEFNVKDLDNVVDGTTTLLQCKICQNIIYADQMKKHKCLVNLKRGIKQDNNNNLIDNSRHDKIDFFNKREINNEKNYLTDEDREKFNSPAYINYLINIKSVVMFHYKMPNLYRKTMLNKKERPCFRNKE